MVQTLTFWAALTGSVLVFWVLPKRARAGFLAAASFAYLATLAPFSACALLGWSMAFYGLAPQARPGRGRRRAIVAGLILAVVTFLFYYKYVPPLLAVVRGSPTAGVAVPLGISYYTFKLIHYVVEVARGTVADRSLSRFACYMFLFPIFSAGPIERYDHFVAHADERWQLDSTVAGLTRIIHGLVKKFVIAEIGLTLYAGSVGGPYVLEHLTELSTARVWLVVVTTYLYYYMDFSAYTDIAIGCSRLFGLRIMENFNFPLIAPNIGEFWRRWHMSLARWCQSYVYMPMLGLFRRPFVALYSSFIVFGLWHAGTLNKVGWALSHASGVAVFRLWSRWARRRKWAFRRHWAWTLASWALTQAFVSACMVFVISESGNGIRDALRLGAKLLFIDLSL